MFKLKLAVFALLFLSGGFLLAASAWSVEPPADKTSESAAVAGARDRAKLMHQICETTLHVMHERYFRDERSIVPARALEDVFAEIEKNSKVKARWISVNLPAMSVTHEPKSPFEKQAARELTAGKKEFETVEDGYYRRAESIPLAASCVACHTGFFKEPPKTPRFAALVISVPLPVE